MPVGPSGVQPALQFADPGRLGVGPEGAEAVLKRTAGLASEPRDRVQQQRAPSPQGQERDDQQGENHTAIVQRTRRAREARPARVAPATIGHRYNERTSASDVDQVESIRWMAPMRDGSFAHGTRSRLSLKR